MRHEWLKARQTKYTAYATVYIAVVIAVLGAVNFLANRYPKAWDSTANKQFSLSDQTVKVVKALNRDIHVYYFDDATRFPAARDLLDRYQAISPKFRVEYLDPVKKPQVARAAGYRRDVNVLIDSGVRKEEAKSLTEEEVTGALIRSLKTGERNACFVTGSGEHSMEDTERAGYSDVRDSLQRNNYKTRTISLLQSAPAASPAAPAVPATPPAGAKPEVPKDCTVTVVGGPRYAYTQPAADALKTYVEGGGHALVMLDPALKTAREETVENTPLVAVLAGWGVTLNKDLALDTSGIGQVFGLGPEVPLVVNYEAHPIVRDMKEIATAFPLARSLETKSTDKATVENLFSTGTNSYATTELSSGKITLDPKKDRKGPLPLAAAGTYKGAQQGRFVVVGSSMWATNSFIRFNGNRDLFLNMVNWLTSDEDLISIRPKDQEDRPMNISAQRLNAIFWLSIVFFPLSIVLIGLVTWWKRR